MDRLDNISPNADASEINASEARRDTRKRIEKGLHDNTPDKVIINNIMLTVMVVIAALVSFTDFTLSIGKIQKLTALAVFLYIITSLVYQNSYAKGKLRGKSDLEYIAALNEYRRKREGIYSKSVAGIVPEFCRYYKAKEIEDYRRGLLSDVEIDYSEYKSEYRRLTFWQVLRLKLPLDMKKAIIKCNRAKPIRLAPGLILNENGEMDRDKLIGQSGKERERRDKRNHLLSRAIIVLFGAAVVINIIFDFSYMTIIQWSVRMLPIISAVLMGDDSGYCNITVTETTFKRDQVLVINLFNEYVAEKEKIERESESEEINYD